MGQVSVSPQNTDTPRVLSSEGARGKIFQSAVEIPLTQGKVAFVDPCDSHLLRYKWHFNTGYARRSLKYPRQGILLHHAIVGVPLKGMEVDHIDGNGLNNTRNNLRIVTHRQNLQNKRNRRMGNCSSKFVGVTKKRGKWEARIEIKNVTWHLGCFEKEIDAAKAYEEAVSRCSR